MLYLLIPQAGNPCMFTCPFTFKPLPVGHLIPDLGVNSRFMTELPAFHDIIFMAFIILRQNLGKIWTPSTSQAMLKECQQSS